MRKCIYITDDGWWDTDITILPQIVNDYEVTVVVAEKIHLVLFKNLQEVYQVQKTTSNFFYKRKQHSFSTFIFVLIT